MDEYHQVRFDNLYMSAKFSLGFLNHPKKVMIKGVSRNISRGVPMKILHQEVTKKYMINSVKETVKVCVFKGVRALATCELAACSVYDTKPVHFFSIFCDNITWLNKTRRTWYKSTSTMILGHFVCLEINYLYKMNMDNIDISDQLRVRYRPYRWMSKQKWWWWMFLQVDLYLRLLIIIDMDLGSSLWTAKDSHCVGAPCTRGSTLAKNIALRKS